MTPNIAGLLALLMWSVSTLLIVYTGPTPPFLLGFLTMFIGGILLLCRDLTAGQKLQDTLRQPFKAYATVTGGVGGYTILLYLAFANAPSFEANTLNYLWPVLLVFFAALLHRDSLTPGKLLGILLGFAGTALLFSTRWQGFDIHYLYGYIFAVAAAVVWAFYSAVTRKIPYPVSLLSVALIITALFSLILHVLFENTVWPQGFAWLAILGLALTRIAYAFWDHAMKQGNVSMLASMAYFLPLISACFFIITGHLPVSAATGLSGALILTGCLLVNTQKLQERLFARYKFKL